jgi:antitoxin VapB
MPVQIANPQVVAKIELLSRAIGVGKTAAVEAAVDRMLVHIKAAPDASDPWSGIDAILAQLHRIPVRPDAFDAVEYDENGLPK